MDERDFEARINAAEAIRFLGDNDKAVADRFWEGYARGVRHSYYGLHFGTEEDHDIWMSAVNHDDPAARAHGYGYQTGVNDHDIEAAQAILKHIRE